MLFNIYPPATKKQQRCYILNESAVCNCLDVFFQCPVDVLSLLGCILDINTYLFGFSMQIYVIKDSNLFQSQNNDMGCELNHRLFDHILSVILLSTLLDITVGNFVMVLQSDSNIRLVNET